MLLRLTVDNYLSFNKETELIMIPSNKIRKKSDHKVKLANVSVLKYAAIYGANAAGKSNLIKAIAFMKLCVSKSLSPLSANDYCRNCEGNIKRPSLFEIQFSLDGNYYAYGFSAILNTTQIASEWLYKINKLNDPEKIFEWDKSKNPTYGEGLELNNSDIVRLQTYFEDFDENGNMLFLKFMNSNKKYSDDSSLYVFKKIYDFIANDIVIVTPNTTVTDISHYYNNTSIASISNLLQLFDTGISDIFIEEISMAELEKEIPEPIITDIIKTVKEKLETDNNSDPMLSIRSDYSFYNIEFKADGELKITTMKFRHRNSFYDFKFADESDGTRRLIDLVDMLLETSDERIYVADEIERSLHPKLMQKFIEIFNERHSTDRVQLIFTTHESTIMDQELFRRDEIWFVERDSNSCSYIYPLDKFKERYDKKLSKAYLDGRYGAIPVFKQFKFKEK